MARLRWLLPAVALSLASSQLGAAEAPPHPRTLEVPGLAPLHYFEPSDAARSQTLYVYLHGRGAKPAEECARWAAVVRPRGFLLCPSGPKPYGEGRTWGNAWSPAHAAVLAGIRALQARFGTQLQSGGGYTLIGFSEGAYAAMNLGLREPKLFDKWLILAANSKYWGQTERNLLSAVRADMAGVYLLSGVTDMVAAAARDVELLLRKAGVPTRRELVKLMGHELVMEERPELYRAAFDWLDAQRRSSPDTK